METWSRSRGDKLFDFMNISFFILVLVIIMYPLYFMVIASVSNPELTNLGKVLLFPKGFTLDGYAQIFQEERIWRGYQNTILYTVTGTALSVTLTMTAAYALARKDLPLRKFLMIAITFTMFFSGGLIPTYLLVKNLGMVNTIWALILPSAVSVYQLIIARTFLQSNIPDELLEAAVMDGCNNTRFFFRIILPLSQPIIAVLVLFNAVAHWNSYFQALIYLRDVHLQPLQIVLRDILIQSEASDMSGGAAGEAMKQLHLAELIKYGVVIVASVPMLILYPFVQKYFVKGVMIGSIKG